MNTKAERQTQVQAAMARIEALLDNADPGRQTLEKISVVLQELAQHPELFPPQDFPAPQAQATSSRYMLAQRSAEGCTLYMNVINPGKASKPHNHGTWAVIAALSGEELNRTYLRSDDGSDPERASLQQTGEFVVRPGSPITFLPDDIHSIHVGGTQTVRHFHLYGKPLETLTSRLGYDLETGKVHGYNKAFMEPTVASDA